MLAAAGGLSLAIWIYLLLGRGWFWRFSQSEAPRLETAPRIAVVIPARNEGAVIGQAVASLLRQDYPGPSHIFVCDDHSSDGTGEAVRRCGAADRLTVVPAQDLPRGWTGKLWALSEGLRAAASYGADYYLFTDADIVHEPGNCSSLVGRAETFSLDMVSYMAKLQCRSFAERALIPAFVFFFFMLYPPSWTARRDRKTAGAAGGCILIRASALDRIGGIASIRGELIDDCALARRVKQSGGQVWMEPASRAASIRDYSTFGEVGAMISRTAFTQLRHSPLLLAGTVAGLSITYLAPPLLLVSGNSIAAALGAASWLLMTLAFLPAVRFYDLAPLRALTLPAVAVFYTIATIQSAIHYWTGRGGQWKGRFQDG